MSEITHERENTLIKESGESPCDSPANATERKSARPRELFYIRLMEIVTCGWLAVLALYFVAVPPNFLRMWPHELGELLTGWFAPLAMAWVAVAVFVQKEQLNAQKFEIQQNSAAVKVQGEQLRRSVEQLEIQTKNMVLETARRDREQAYALMERLCERLMFGAERIARIVEGRTLRSQDSHKHDVTEIIGQWLMYAECSRGHEVARSLDALAKGLNTVVELIRGGWVFDLSFPTLQELCKELRQIDRVAMEVQRVNSAISGDKPLACVLFDFDSNIFREHVRKAYTEFEAIEARLLNLGYTEP